MTEVFVAPQPRVSVPVLANPLLPCPSQDPFVTSHNGEFLAVNTNGRRIFVRRSPDVGDLYNQAPVCIWTAPSRGPHSRHLWAPELHRVDGRWFVYYAADSGLNRTHRVWILEAQNDNPAGRYVSLGELATGGWAIDATLLCGAGGQLYGVWSGWETQMPGPQNLYLAPMSDAATVAGPRVCISTPTHEWERHGAAVCEGPAVLRRDGLTCIVYSAGASWTTRSCLGMLVNRTGDYLDPGAWHKCGPVFAPTVDVWGLGHCSFVRDPASGVDLIFYHAKTQRRRGWRDRNIRAQAFGWTDDGLPNFGEPSAPISAGGYIPSIQKLSATRRPYILSS